MEYKTLIFNDRKISYRIAGSGEAIVLLHGFMESSDIWINFGNELARNFLCIAPDLPGHGQSDSFGDIHGMDFMATTVKAILDENQINKCVMIGHSMGGYVTLEFARKYPSMLNGLALFHSTALADTDENKRNRERAIEINRQNKLDYISQFIPSLFADFNVKKFRTEITTLIEKSKKMMPEAIIAAQAGMKERASALDVLTNIQCPVLFIAGKHDSRIPTEKIMAQAILPPHSEVLILEKAGHMGFIEAYTETLGVVRCFAERAFY